MLLEAARVSGLHTFTSTAVWNTPPAIRSAALTAAPWLAEALDELPRGVPVPGTCAPFIARHFLRLPGSNRAFAASPVSFDAEVPARKGAGVLVFKGAEPLAADFEEFLVERRHASDLRKAGTAFWLDDLAVTEGKAPACVMRREALAEAETAAAVHARHLSVYGTLAHLPVPLAIVPLPPDEQRRAAERVRRVLSAPAWQRVAAGVEAGLATYVYWYPALPVRANQLASFLPRAVRDRLELLSDPAAPGGRAIEGWVRCFARLVLLGFLPATVASLETGNPCQPQNAVVDGGFVDTDAITPVGDADDAWLADGLEYAFTSLCNAVLVLISGPGDPGYSARSGNAALWEVRRHLAGRISAALQAEARPGTALDARVARFFEAAPGWEQLRAVLGSLYPPAGRLDHGTAAPSFLQLAPKLRDWL